MAASGPRTPFSVNRKKPTGSTNGKVTTPFTLSARKKLGHSTGKKSTGGKTPNGRFIASRQSLKDASEVFNALDGSDNPASASDPLARLLFNGNEDDENSDASKVLTFGSKTPKKTPSKMSATDELREQLVKNGNSAHKGIGKKQRTISSNPERILDAPDMVDDFYLNLLDWSSTNVLAVGLGANLYLWNASDSSIDALIEEDDPDNIITSVSWTQFGTHLAVGMNNHQVQIWDVQKKSMVRRFNTHNSRVGSLSWNQHVLTSGGKDASIQNHDVRIADHLVVNWEHHTQEICGLKWSPDANQLASGGNDNLACVWELRSEKPKHVFSSHVAAVKALSWSPHQANLLASGGGTADRHIRFWNSSSGASVGEIDTNSQVCSLIWNPFEPEILSAHGFSQNQLTLWKYPTMSPCIDLTGHNARVLHTAISPDGSMVCSAAADETLRFWKVFEPVKKSVKDKKTLESKTSLGSMKLR
jgi:cell division cycle protein 20 (cofactor of APC complex)